MAGQSRRWMILVATVWIQAFTGTNFDFSAYSSEMKAVLGISQVQLNYLATASDLGKAVGWSSGLALMWLPLWAVLMAAAAMGMVGYGGQWLVLRGVVAVPYFVVFLLCLLCGTSICWFNTVCFVLCIRNFPAAVPLSLSLTVAFNGVSAALYNLAAASLDRRAPSGAAYLLLNALLPLIASLAALVPVIRQPPRGPRPPDLVKRDQVTFLKIYALAAVTGVYLLLLRTSDCLTARFLFSGAVVLLVSPLAIPGVVYARDWFERTVYSSFRLDGSGFILVDAEHLEIHKELLSRPSSVENGLNELGNDDVGGRGGGCGACAVEGDRLAMLGQEHSVGMLVRRLDFWLYYAAYFCGGTIGLVYSNNLGQIAQSLGHAVMNSNLITVYSTFSFFGRLLSAAPDFVRTKFYFARTGWLSIALLPTPLAFFFLAALAGDPLAVQAGTALIGLSSGFIFAAAVSITSELFGPESVGVNHNILITNIPIGSLVYGFLSATVYDSNAYKPHSDGLVADTLVCMGKKCYFLTFVGWGCISLIGLGSSVLLFLRTRHAYCRFENSRRSTL
ncbi:Major facilitator superfamily protein [Striga hermonthica]|uniref:Major facilitator superfamily protein n=1 Tax=Striga hermonthica TaxID=68872 RepID=A0A9N7NXF0_STRHE|nr:Major facilitator superfamily protein [Striga hermonthica]